MVNKEQMKTCRRKKLIQSIPEISSPGSFLRPAFSKAVEVKHLLPIAVYALMESPVDILEKGKTKRKRNTTPTANLCLDFSKDIHFFCKEIKPSRTRVFWSSTLGKVAYHR